MKRSLLFLFAVALSLGITRDVRAQVLCTATGAGTVAVNDDYTDAGSNINGKRVYVANSSNTLVYWDTTNSINQWTINDGGEIAVILYRSPWTTLHPPQGGWYVVDGLANPPTISGTDADTENVVVDTAGSNVIGNYPPFDTLNSRHRFRREDNGYNIYWTGGQWNIEDIVNHHIQYKNLSDTWLPPAGGWVAVEGVNPVPTLSGAVTYTPIVVSGATNTSAANGTYPYADTVNGKPRYVRIDNAEISWDATNTRWRILGTSGQHYFYTTAGTKIPPTGTWLVDAAGAAPAPSLSGGIDPLPVQLASFTASSDRFDAELRWTAVTQVDNEGWQVERSANGNPKSANTEWTVAGFVNGGGTVTYSMQYSFVDRDLAPGLYSYRLKQLDRSGVFEYSHFVQVNIAFTPKAFALGQNFPNPFNPSTQISFQLPKETYVNLEVFNVLGEHVATLVDGEKPAGIYSARFDGSGLSSGMYYYRLRAGDYVATKKLMLMK